jgi:hypothetical protein
LGWLLPFIMLAGGDTLTRLETEARVARQELEAAQSGAFYLIVDATEKKVTLKIRGVDLRSFAVQSIEMGAVLRGGRGSIGWAESLHDFARTQSLARKELQPEKTAETGNSNLLDEEREPTPPVFRIACGPALSIRFIPEGRRGLWAGISDRVVGPDEPRGAIRLRIRLAPSDYEELYRSMPERGKLIVVIPGATSRKPTRVSTSSSK